MGPREGPCDTWQLRHVPPCSLTAVGVPPGQRPTGSTEDEATECRSHGQRMSPLRGPAKSKRLTTGVIGHLGAGCALGWMEEVVPGALMSPKQEKEDSEENTPKVKQVVISFDASRPSDGTVTPRCRRPLPRLVGAFRPAAGLHEGCSSGGCSTTTPDVAGRLLLGPHGHGNRRVGIFAFH